MSVCTKPEEEQIWFISWQCLFSIFIFYVNENQNILDLYHQAPVQFPFTRGIPHSLLLAGLRLFHASCQAWHNRGSWPDGLDDFHLWSWKQKAFFLVPCIILAWQSVCCLWCACVLFKLLHSAVFTIISKLSTLPFRKSSPISRYIEVIPQKIEFCLLM